MLLGYVIGNVWATRKEEGLEKLKLLVIQPIDAKNNPIRNHFVAADRIGAGVGDKVLITNGSASRFILKEQSLPVDAVVVGIVDSTEIERGGPYE